MATDHSDGESPGRKQDKAARLDEDLKRLNQQGEEARPENDVSPRQSNDEADSGR